jgi:hypothetical protein
MLITLAIVLVGLLFAWNDISGQIEEANCTGRCYEYQLLSEETGDEYRFNGSIYKLKQ